MKQVSREQKKIISYFAGGIAFLILFLFLIYFPQGRRLKKIKAELTALETEISQINALTEGRPMEDAVKDFNLRLSKMAAMLPNQEDEVVKILSEEAKNFKIDVQNIKPHAGRVLAGKVPGFEIAEVLFSLRLLCTYRGLGEYLESLKESSSVLVRVKQLTIRGEGENKPQLLVDLELAAYLTKR